MELSIRPYEGVGPIDFNMRSEEVTGILGTPSHEIRPNRWRYREPGLFIEFDQHGLCSFVEAEYSKNELSVRDIPLSGSYADITNRLRNAGYGLIRGSAETTYCPDLGLSLWCSEDDQVETIGGWRRGLWNDLPMGPDS